MRPSSSRAGRQAGWRENRPPPPCLLARPTTGTRAGEGEAGEESSNVSLLPCPKGFRSLCPYKRPTAGPRTNRGGHRAPPLPFAFWFSGGFCRTQPAPSAAGDSTPQDGEAVSERLSRSRLAGLGGCLKGSPAGVPPAPHRKDKTPSRGGLGLAVNFSHCCARVPEPVSDGAVEILNVPRRVHPVPPVQTAPPVLAVSRFQFRHPLFFQLPCVLVPEAV